MGWAFGKGDDGRDIGYGVQARCDHPGCTARIDRGLAYVCGEMHGGDNHGCGKYFCEEHRDYIWPDGEDKRGVQVCLACASIIKAN